MVPFPALVLAIAVLPVALPRAWERRRLQVSIVALCGVPVVVHFVLAAQLHAVADAAQSYLSFVTTLGALYVTSGGVQLSVDVEARPATNVGLVVLGAALASFVGTTGAAMLLIRPFLRINRRRQHRAHLAPFFIIAVANAGGLLTPLGDPPLLLGYLAGVPFFWTLRLLPAWLLYVGSTALALYLVERRACARESPDALARGESEVARLRLRGKRNVALLACVVPAALLPAGLREGAMVAIATASLALTPRALHEANGFSFAPILDVAIVFAGLFACVGPVETALARAAPGLPVQEAWQLFWASGLLSGVLDNAPTYKVFAALARGISRPGPDLVAGVSAVKLAAISVGTVVMGGATYIGNAPNLLVKAIAERERFPTPAFFRYALFALAVMMPAHLVTTLALMLLDRR
jgi:Na+/H+ antiporter NhaD/arsenite permease-like protein